ncbi:SAM-dependent chlorinase/fluorinase like protein [Aduncisulcus paluster]|uniref:SAM-dependent chlorinase/fluorinase like protein n=1 Tax=Aduncisulcus paluster TaxID=2918883 RepID=A0ABQ5KUY2_9EUKA|nr:SAM-dependent chlorinase/fluorinase like protein [Aduncisulcus paluster]
MPITISFCSDFGLEDYYVGQVKHVIRRISPSTSVIDLTHQVPRQNVILGSLFVANTLPYVGPNTIHLSIIDPSVGTERKGILATLPNPFKGVIIAPDNGFLQYVCHFAKIDINDVQIYFIRSTPTPFVIRPLLAEVGCTFDGRDLFGPAAGELARFMIEIGEEKLSAAEDRIYPDPIVDELSEMKKEEKLENESDILSPDPIVVTPSGSEMKKVESKSLGEITPGKIHKRGAFYLLHENDKASISLGSLVLDRAEESDLTKPDIDLTSKQLYYISRTIDSDVHYVHAFVLHVDHYGNCIISAPYSCFKKAAEADTTCTVEIGGELLSGDEYQGAKFSTAATITKGYACVEVGEWCITGNSYGLIELAINQGNALEELSEEYEPEIDASSLFMTSVFITWNEGE